MGFNLHSCLLHVMAALCWEIISFLNLAHSPQAFLLWNQPAVLCTPALGDLASPDHVTSRTRDPGHSVNELILISLANQHFWICSLVGCRFWRCFGVDLLPLGCLLLLTPVHVPEAWDTAARLPLSRLHLWRRICSSSTLWILSVWRGYQSGAPQLPFLPGNLF